MTLEFSSKLSTRNIQNLSFKLEDESIETKSIKLTSNNKKIETILKLSKNEVNQKDLEISLPKDEALYSEDGKSTFSNFPIKYRMNYFLPSLSKSFENISTPV